MADQLERRFEGVDHATMPDLWGAIEVRAQRPAPQPRGPRVAALVLAVIVAAAVIGGLVWALRNRGSQPAVPPGVNGDIGFIGVAPGQKTKDVIEIDPSTGVAHDLTNTKHANEDSAVWSPDGSMVIFTRLVRAGGQVKTVLVLLRAGSERVLATCPWQARELDCSSLGAPGTVAWSPDGMSVAWVMPVATRGWILQVYGVATGRITRLCSQAECGPGIASLSWSLDGTEIAFANVAPLPVPISTTPASQIWVQPANGSSPAIAVTGPQDGCLTGEGCYDVDPAWSPDGRVIAFLRLNPEAHTGEVDTIHADGSRLRGLTECPGRDGCLGVFAPAWSRDGAKLAVAIQHMPSSGRPGVRVIEARSGITRDLPVCGGCSGAVSLAWSPDATSLVFVAATLMTYENGIYVMKADGSGLRRIPWDGAVDTLSPVVWLPKGAFPSATPTRGAPVAAAGAIGFVGPADDPGGISNRDVFVVDLSSAPRQT
jgi:Tol biopolymer transport system component